MKFEVDVEKLVDYGMPLNQLLFCQFIYQQDQKYLGFYQEQFKFVTRTDLDSLVEQGYIGLNDIKMGYRFSNFYITNKFIDRFIEKSKISKLDDTTEGWIETWFNLFPKGIKSGGYLVRSDLNGCINKMKKFRKKYPKFTKEIILKATSNYIDYSRMNNWRYMQLAHYFIFKNDISTLAGQCELIIDNIENGKNINLDITQYDSENNLFIEEQQGGLDRL